MAVAGLPQAFDLHYKTRVSVYGCLEGIVSPESYQQLGETWAQHLERERGGTAGKPYPDPITVANGNDKILLHASHILVPPDRSAAQLAGKNFLRLAGFLPAAGLIEF